MSVTSLTSAQRAQAESRRPAARQSGPSGPSFQERLAQTTEASRSAAPSSRNALQRDSLLSSLSDFRSSLLEKMKLAKEKEEEQEAWDKLMEYLDAWIESLREEGDVRKIARAHAALTALQADAGSDRPDPGDYLLERLETLIS